MIAHLLSLALVTVFSFPASANNNDELFGEARLKQLATCDEIEGAKHLSLALPLAIISIFSPHTLAAMRPYQNAMSTAASCRDLSSAYRILTALYVLNSGQDVETYFTSEEGQEGLEKMADILRKLKR